LKITVENAGATGGSLIAVLDDHLYLRATGTWSDSPKGRTFLTKSHDTPLSQSNPPQVPVKLVTRAFNSHQEITIDQADRDIHLSVDPYVTKSGVKSALCLPVTAQGKIIAILYLENRIATHSFTPHRLKSLKVLAAQAAIALVNARYLQTLKASSQRIEGLTDQTVALKRVNEDKTRFFQNVSHELRTPLTLILGVADRLAQKGQDPSETDLLQRNSKRLYRLVNQLLDFQKITTTGLNLSSHTVDLGRLVESCVASFRQVAAHRSIEIRISLPDPLPVHIRADIEAVEKIIFNYLSNAWKHSPEPAVIDLCHAFSTLDEIDKFSVSSLLLCAA
ncbi:hypothetical protein E3A20_29830, partial [Planctomyces bekefii]